MIRPAHPALPSRWPPARAGGHPALVRLAYRSRPDERGTPTSVPTNRFALVVAAALFLGLAGPGCTRPTPPATGKAATAGPSATDYKLTGVVRRVDPKAGLVTIRHDAIPG